MLQHSECSRVIAVITLLISAVMAAPVSLAAGSNTKLGKAVYMDRSRGNCITCHAIADPDAELAGKQGPALTAIQQRFPDRRLLRLQVWDASRNNPLTMMPPFGRHGILTEDEIDAVVDYIYQF